jgi:DNA-binding transcriptional LysR family regulator
VPLNPWRLRLLCQLETLGTVRAVATAVHQSPSSVSQQLAVLETEAGVQLLERAGRGVRLTATGHLLARRGRDILDAMAQTEAELRALEAAPTGVVRVASFQSGIHSLVMPAIRKMSATHPGLEVQVDEMEVHLSTPALLRGEVDVIVTSSDFIDAPKLDLLMTPLTTDSIVVVAPRGHRVERQDRVDLSSLADEPWTFEFPGAYLSTIATRLCRSAGFEPKVICQFNNYLITLQHVEAGGSITLLPELAVDRRFDIITRELNPPIQRKISSAIRPSSSARGSVLAVLDALSAVAAEHNAAKDGA